MFGKKRPRKEETKFEKGDGPLSLTSGETTRFVEWTPEQEAELKKQTEEASEEELAEGKRLWDDIMTRAIDYAIKRNPGYKE